MNDEKLKSFTEHLKNIDSALDIFCNSLSVFHIDLKTLLFKLPHNNEPPLFTTPEKEQIYTDIQTNLDNITHLLFDDPRHIFTNPVTLEFRSQISANIKSIHNNLNKVRVHHE